MVRYDLLVSADDGNGQTYFDSRRESACDVECKPEKPCGQRNILGAEVDGKADGRRTTLNVTSPHLCEQRWRKWVIGKRGTGRRIRERRFGLELAPFILTARRSRPRARGEFPERELTTAAV